MLHPMPEIGTLLKSLNLSRIAQTLPERNREAIERKLSPTEFLALVLQDEQLGRENRRFQVRIKRAGVEPDKTLERFDFDFNPRINVQQVREITTCQFIAEKVSVIIVGPSGTGKSHLAQAVTHCAIRKGIDALWISQSRLFADIAASKAIGGYSKKFSFLVKIPLLVIDDFGLRPMRSPEDEDFHDLISERYERAATIVTSNLDFSEWGNAFPNKLLAAATLDRLRHNAHQVILDGKSYRAERRTSRQKIEGKK